MKKHQKKYNSFIAQTIGKKVSKYAKEGRTYPIPESVLLSCPIVLFAYIDEGIKDRTRFSEIIKDRSGSEFRVVFSFLERKEKIVRLQFHIEYLTA